MRGSRPDCPDLDVRADLPPPCEVRLHYGRFLAVDDDRSCELALVTCRECGAEVSDQAPACPRCGVSSPSGSATLTFWRKGTRNAAVSTQIFVDGQPYGAVVGLKGRVVVPVTPGDHHIELRCRYKSAVATVNAKSGDTAFRVTVSTMGKPTMSQEAP
jgi:hypothetical protein